MKKDNNKTFKITPPPIPRQKQNLDINTEIQSFRTAVELQYIAMMNFKDETITEENKEKLERLIFATEDLISNCMENDKYFGNRDQYFINLIFICHKLSLRIETYKIEEKVNELNAKSNIIDANQKELEEKQARTEETNNNLVYNLLGFLTSFSIVSAVVGVITKIEGIVNVMLFMAFTVLILLTTLIGLHNFYKSNNKKENKLQDNYFLWKIIVIIIIILFTILGIQFIKDNKDNIYSYIDNKVENMIEEKLENKIK